MGENIKQVEALLERTVEYGEASLELIKLKALDKTSDIVSSFIPRSFVLVLIATFMLFLNLGLALWIGEILGKNWYGFFAIAAFYGVAAIIINFFMHKWLKKIACNYIIKQLLK